MLDPGGPADLWWIRRGGGNATTQGGTFCQPFAGGDDLLLASDCEDGASPVPWLAIQVGSDHGLYVGWEFSGLGRIHARPAADGAADGDARLDLDVGHHPDFRTDVEPGETLRIPAAFVGCYRGDLDEGSYSLHRFVLEKLRPPVPRGCPDPILAYNLYLDVGGNRATEADVLRSARFCRDMGFEVFMPDAMWCPETGDWRWDPRRFPRGIEPIREYVHGAGMKLALWCAWTNGGVSPHPEALSVRGPVGRPGWFNTDVGLDDSSHGGSVQFQVLADGVQVAESPILAPGQVHRFQTRIAGSRQITLRVLNGGDGYSCDHAVWGAARVVDAGVQDPLDNGS